MKTRSILGRVFGILVILAFLAVLVIYSGASDWGRAMIEVALMHAAIYASYLVALGLAVWLWRSERRAFGVGLGAAVLGFGLAFPLIDRVSYLDEQSAVASSHIVPETLDLTGRTILVIDGSLGCHDLCEAILRHRAPAALYTADLSPATRAAFAATGVLPHEVHVSRQRINEAGRMGSDRSAGKVDLSTIDYVILSDFFGEFGAARAADLPRGVNPAHVGLSVLMAPVPGAGRIDVASLDPDLLLFYHARRGYSVPFNPLYRVDIPVPGYRFEDRLLGGLLCDPPGRRLHGPCRIPPAG